MKRAWLEGNEPYQLLAYICIYVYDSSDRHMIFHGMLSQLVDEVEHHADCKSYRWTINDA
jgi:hypothetical protein